MKKQYVALILLVSTHISTLKSADVSFTNNEHKNRWENMLATVQDIAQTNKATSMELFQQFQDKSITSDELSKAIGRLFNKEYRAKEYIRLSNHSNKPIEIRDNLSRNIISTIQPHKSSVVKSSSGGASTYLSAPNNNEIEWTERGKGMHFHIHEDASGNFSVTSEDPFEK